MKTSKKGPTKTERAAFANRLKHLQEACGLPDQKTLAAVCGLDSAQMVTNWKRRARVGSESEAKVYDATGVSMDWLQRGKGIAFPEGAIRYAHGKRLPFVLQPLPPKKHTFQAQIDLDLLETIFLGISTLERGTPQEKAALARKVYEVVAGGDEPNTKATVLRLVTSGGRLLRRPP